VAYVRTVKTTELVTSVLEQALFTRRYAQFHFTATDLAIRRRAVSIRRSRLPRRCAIAGIAGSTGSVGDALDNALMESAVRLYMSELIDQHSTLTGRAELERESASWVHWKKQRPDSTRRSSIDRWSSTRSYHQAVTSPEVA
jgi:putative transposase